MALADMRGADDTECLELARLASKAVDFSKSGVPVSENEIPQVPEYPDFMGKDYKAIRIFQKQPMNVYPSEKVLGRMFRTIDPEPVFEEADGAFSGDPRLISLQVSIDYEHYLIAAGQHKAQYEFGLMGLLRRYDITEAECAAGLLLRSPRTRMKLERDFDQREAVREAYTTLLSSALSRVEAFLEQNGVEDQETDRRIWALASYKVTYDRGFSKYLSVDWSQIDLEILDDDGEGYLAGPGEEEYLAGPGEEEYLAGPGEEDESGAFQRLFSFAWLLHDDLLALL
ncbi:hypothetical protein PHLCEN_2v11767 [Hermanssonia centrifuga]|uniref:RNA-dependent RNA polymerase n=1 Tax=Hermanssonia centrifuga TaxID=98765 RepID=A0A2R6NJ82_9APHY|nr:hypothetical protein PHLCEN_2v11767 [Hermanssonia centrifuga]